MPTVWPGVDEFAMPELNDTPLLWQTLIQWFCLHTGYSLVVATLLDAR